MLKLIPDAFAVAAFIYYSIEFDLFNIYLFFFFKSFIYLLHSNPSLFISSVSLLFLVVSTLSTYNKFVLFGQFHVDFLFFIPLLPTILKSLKILSKDYSSYTVEERISSALSERECTLLYY